MSEKYALTTIDYITEKRKPVIVLFCRNPETGKRKTVRVHNFKPYLYIQSKHFFLIPKSFRITKQQTRFRDIFNREVMKVEVDVPKTVKEIRTFFTKSKAPTWEADILFPLRYLIDNGIFGGIQREWGGIVNADVPSIVRAFYYDIEVFSKRGTKVSPRNPEPIICITTYDSFTEEYTTFYWNDEKELPTSMNATMIRCGNEKEMLLRFAKCLRKYDPDLIVGFWNQRYDDIKVYTRMKGFKLDVRMLSPVQQVQDRGDEEGITIKGRECFDLYWAYRILNPKELLEYSLDQVCLNELGEKKVPIYDFVEDWEQRPEEVIRRNQRDVELMVKLNDKLQMIEYFDESRKVIGCRFQDIFKRSRVADILLLRWCHEREIALPSKWEQEFVPQVGAIVFEPVPGIYENVMYLDFTAMYPSIVISFNICPTTYSPFEGIPVNKERDYYYLPKQVKQGIVPGLLQDILTLRWDIQERMEQAKADGDDEAYDRYFYQQQSVKFQANALYGVLKYRSFRMFSAKAAESIAWMGRRILLMARDIIENELGLPVIYGDTDGLMILGRDGIPLQKQADDAVKQINKSIKQRIIDELGVHDADIKIKEEALITKLLIPTRKKYAYVDIEGNHKERGLAKIRSDCSDEARDIQNEVIQMIFAENSKEEILEYCRERISRVRHGKVRPYQIAVPKRITKDFDKYSTNPIHLTAAKYSNEHLGTVFMGGSKPRYIYVKQVPKQYPFHKAIALEEYRDPPEGFIYDWEMMIEKELRGKLEDILNILGIAWEQLHVHSLDKWFG